ncbi:MerR family transcriptional regulator [Geomicrobium sp. JCM 19039]|uniref:MerR family transcriptional regulator n=1 Tax=Geomicrobium sp. JCM 19039 TaxID=1460636 RepID=UPI00045F1C2B|nr:MerR family transcriptional regulator [Geomicrobium sp. JCM 19039]GAK10533.1 transcriptional regulator, MerR family [Geomicrobium sp. JCM 19039]
MYTIGTLSKKTGVTIRTLDYYDEIGLLSPHNKTEGGHRLYSDEEVFRLEKILSLKFLGLSLETIQSFMKERTTTWEAELSRQMRMVQQQKERLTQIETAIRSVLYSVKVEHDVNWAVIFQVMNLYQEGMMPANDTLNQYLNNEEKERMLSISYDQQTEEQWLALIQDIRSNLHELPTSTVAQQLLDRWLAGTYEMYGEDKQFLGKTWT